MASTLAAPAYSNGMWFVQSSSPPDRNIPSSLPPPGNAPGAGFWAIQNQSVPSGSSKAKAIRWVWCPLPAGNIVLVQSPSGPVPTVSLGAAQLLTALPSGTQLQDGPWPALRTDSSVYSGVVGPPSIDPSGWSGGTWTSIAGSSGLWVYDNGTLSSSNAGLWAALGVAAAGGIGYVAMRK